MAQTEPSIGLLLLLTCCFATLDAQGWRNWFWGGSSEATTLVPTEAAVAEEQMTEQLTTPEGPTIPPEATTQQKGKVWKIFTVKRPALTEEMTVPEATPPSKPGGQEGNIAGVGAEILNVAEGIRNLVQQWDEKKIARGTEMPDAPTTVLPKVSASPTTEPADTHNVTAANTTTDAQISAATGQPEIALPVTTKPVFLWNKTRVFFKEPEAPIPGSASFSFSPDDRARGNRLAFQESTDAGQETAATPGRADRGAFSKKQGILAKANVLGLQEPQANSSMHVGIPSKVVGALDNWLTHYITISNQSVSSGNRTQLGLKNNPSFNHSGIAVADANKKHSHDSVSNSNAINFMDSPPANNSESLGFLLTYTLQHFSNSSTGLPSSFPGLTPTAGHCLPLPTKLSYCNNLGMKRFRLPNYLHHGSEEEIRAALHEWEGLLKSRCHRYLEWFFCLLLVPGCNAYLPITPPPCRGFCEALKDLCWTHLKEGHLPISCDSLPTEDDVYSCVFVNISAGNVAGVRPHANFLSLLQVGSFYERLCSIGKSQSVD